MGRVLCCSYGGAWPHGFVQDSRRIQLPQVNCSRTQQPAGLSLALPDMKMDDPVEDSASLLYQPYLEYLCQALLTSAPGLQSLPLEDQISFKASSKSAQKAKVYNWLYSTERLRRIRITYFDAGRSCQAFNALLYPDTRFDLPLLGIDLLSFGSSKILCVVDYIPLSRDSSYVSKYIRPLAALRQPFATHCGQMSDRFFDKDTFASEEMVFYRSSLGASEPELQVPSGGMYKVYMDYVDAFLATLNNQSPEENPDFRSEVLKQQRAYDQYLAERDPAFKIFSSYFGKEWTGKFCSDFLCPGLHP